MVENCVVFLRSLAAKRGALKLGMVSSVLMMTICNRIATAVSRPAKGKEEYHALYLFNQVGSPVVQTRARIQKVDSVIKSKDTYKK